MNKDYVTLLESAQQRKVNSFKRAWFAFDTCPRAESTMEKWQTLKSRDKFACLLYTNAHVQYYGHVSSRTTTSRLDSSRINISGLQLVTSTWGNTYRHEGPDTYAYQKKAVYQQKKQRTDSINNSWHDRVMTPCKFIKKVSKFCWEIWSILIKEMVGLFWRPYLSPNTY